MGIASYMRAHGLWNVLHIERGLMEQVPEIAKRQKFDGVIARIENTKIGQELAQLKVPTVDLRGVYQPKNGVTFNTDPDAVAEMAQEHFRERGFQHLGFCGYEGIDFSDQRSEFFVEHCLRRNIRPFVFSSQSNQGSNSKQDLGTLQQEAAGELLEPDLIAWLQELPKPIGILACNDVRGRQVLAAARTAGLRVPGQVAVLGVDDDEVVCDLANPPMSSIEPDTQRLGFEGATILAQLMAGKKVTQSRILIPPIRIAVRQSTDVIAVDDPAVAMALEFIQSHACTGIGVNDVANAISVSRATLERRFREYLNRSPREEIERAKISQVRTLLIETDYSLDRIAGLTAFATASHLLTSFRRVIGCTPGEYRKQVHGNRS